MKIWKVIFATLVIFSAGLVTGAVLFRQAKPVAAPKETRTDFSPPTPVIVQDRFLQMMKRELNLSPEQVTKLDAVFAESRERTQILMDLINPELQAEKREVAEKIRAELTPEQRTKFEQIMKHPRPPQNDRRDDRGPRPHRPRPGEGTNDKPAAPAPER